MRKPPAKASKGSRTTSPARSTRDKHVSTGQRDSGRHIDNEVRNEAALRWLSCHTLLNYVLGERVSYAKLGVLLSGEFPWRKRPYDQSITFRIASGERSIRLEDVVAFVRVLKQHGVIVDPGWLAFGDESTAPPPDPELLDNARRALADP